MSFRFPSDLLPDAQDIEERILRRLHASWDQQPTFVRRARMGYVLRMAGELADIRKATIFSTKLCEIAIEAVITGDADDLRMWARFMTFEEEDEAVRVKYAPVFASFKATCDEAAAALDGLEQARAGKLDDN